MNKGNQRGFLNIGRLHERNTATHLSQSCRTLDLLDSLHITSYHYMLLESQNTCLIPAWIASGRNDNWYPSWNYITLYGFYSILQHLRPAQTRPSTSGMGGFCIVQRGMHGTRSLIQWSIFATNVCIKSLRRNRYQSLSNFNLQLTG